MSRAAPPSLCLPLPRKRPASLVNSCAEPAPGAPSHNLHVDALRCARQSFAPSALALWSHHSSRLRRRAARGDQCVLASAVRRWRSAALCASPLFRIRPCVLVLCSPREAVRVAGLAASRPRGEQPGGGAEAPWRHPRRRPLPTRAPGRRLHRRSRQWHSRGRLTMSQICLSAPVASSSHA